MAFADPVNLILSLGQRQRVLDLIDEAILYTYVGDKLALLRSVGIRGVLELVETVDELKDPDPATQRDATDLIGVMAAKLGEGEPAVKNLMRTLSVDPRVKFLQDLWRSSFVDNQAARASAAPAAATSGARLAATSSSASSLQSATGTKAGSS